MTVEARFWDPRTAAPRSRAVSGEAEVEALAAALLDEYQAAGDTVPGIELRRDASGARLSLAVAPFGWALIHTDGAFDQRRTRGAERDSGTVDVGWEEVTPIPRGWFIPKAQALQGVTRWIDDGGLADELTWSDDCA